MNQIIQYQFVLEVAENSAIYFGDSEKGSLVRNAKGQPFLMGNAIGGALREYSQQTLSEEKQSLILKYLGGEIKEENKVKFIESNVFISDGQIQMLTKQLLKKEGTAIDPAYGSALDKMKYELEYLPAGTTITFTVECTVPCENQSPEQLNEKELEFLIHNWAYGFLHGQLLLGGQKSNGFGRLKVLSLNKKVYLLNTPQALDDYIYSTGQEHYPGKPIDVDALQPMGDPSAKQIYFFMHGAFQYGVYQSFKLEDSITGVQKCANGYYLPSTSIKGLIKNEVRQLLNRMIGPHKEQVERKLDKLFGNKNQKGKFIFKDVVIEAPSEVKVERYGEQWIIDDPVYIKIDRLTGGTFSSALKKQREIQGKGTIQFQLMLDDTEKEGLCPYIFPILYVLRKIGSGWVPLGGRAAIGLGQFEAPYIDVRIDQQEIKIQTRESLSKENEEWLRRYYDAFKEWCGQCENEVATV